MSGESNGTLLRVAEAISDGIPIDWDTETASRPDLKDMLVELRKVETLAKVHGTAPDRSAIVSVLDEVAADAEADVTRYEDLPDRVEVSVAGAGIPTTWGPLRILEKIGEGGFGEVYRAFDPALQTEVALKLWRADKLGGREAEDFLAEARKLARVRHPNILTVHGAAEHGGRVGMWTDLLRGETLESLIARGGTFSAKEASSIGGDLCGALAAVHAAGLVHRDVKAANVMRELGGRIVLMDFGSGGELSSDRITLAGEPVFGTPITMAPEQFASYTVGPSADIYSLGVLLFRLVTGRYPVEADTHDELRQKHERGERLHLRDLRADLPAEFVRVVERATAVVPEARFASAGAMEQALVVVSGHVQAGPPAPVPIPDPWWRGWRVPAVAAAAVAIVVAIAMWPGGETGPPQTPGETPVTMVDPGKMDALPDPQNPAPIGGAESAEQVTPRPAPASAQAATLTARASLLRATAVGYERLLAGSRVAPGDQLSLDIESPDEIYVYALNEDEKGETYVLFPTSGLDTENPLAAGTTHRLPGRRFGEWIDWQVSSAGGREMIMVIVSREAQTDLERELAKLPEASPEGATDYAYVPEETKVRLRGIGRVVTGAPPSAAGNGGRLADVIGNLPGSGRGSEDVWLWQIQLENPAD